MSPRPTAEGYEALYDFAVYFEGEEVESYARIEERRLWSFRRRLARLERHLGRRRLRILDVGAATGGFVAEARRRGHDAEGYEPSEGAREEARRKHGVELRGGRLGDLGNDLGGLDVVHLNHVLEHLPEPIRALEGFHSLLSPGGSLLVEVPQQLGNDVDRLKALLGRARTPGFGPYSLHHTFFFTRRSLREMVVGVGFEILGVRTFHWGLAPLWPPSAREVALGTLLWVSDILRGGGPVLELHGRRPS